jgi:hypothetical protein
MKNKPQKEETPKTHMFVKIIPLKPLKSPVRNFSLTNPALCAHMMNF